MEYSNPGSTANLQSSNHMSTEGVHNFGENSNDTRVLSPATYSHYDEKQAYQYQNQPSSLNQLLQNNQYGPYSNLSLRPPVSTNYHTNYRTYENNWNLSRSQVESARIYYSQYQETYPQNTNDINSKGEKIKPNDYNMVNSELQGNSNYKSENRNYLNNKLDKSKSNFSDWKHKNEPISSLDGNNKDNMLKTDVEIKSDKQNSTESSDLNTSKSDSNVNTGFHLNTSCSDLSSDKNDMHNGPNYIYENKINQQSQMKPQTTGGYDNQMYNQMMMQSQNSAYYSQFRYTNPPPPNNTHNYINPNNSAIMSSSMSRPPLFNYPNYIQMSNSGSGYGGYHPSNILHQNRPLNVHSPFVSRGDQSPFSPNPDNYMNGSIPSHQNNSGGLKELSERKEEINVLVNINQDTSSAGSNSNKSVNARSCASKTKNAQKNESHPATPVSNTVPSPSQTSMSSMIDENEDSVSSLGPSETGLLHHTSLSNQSQFNQHQMTQMSQNHSMVYPQSYPNSQVPHTMISSFPSHLPPQHRPFTPSSNMISNRQIYHNESQINNSCYQKLMELGNEPERGPWIERYLRFMQENNTPLSAVPTVVKQPLDLFRLYHAVRERGGLLNVVKTKRWKEICLIVNVNASASGAYTLRRNYIKCLLDYECKFDRNGVDPGPILQEIQSLSDKKKKSTSRNTGSSPSSTISSGQTSQHNSEYGNTSTPRPPLAHPDFNTPHPFHGHNPYNNVFHNGSMMHRSPMHYQAQRGQNPYPGPYTGPRMMGFNSPVNAMHPHVRYDANIPPNWNKSIVMNQQQQWPSSGSTNNSTHPMQMPMSPGAPSNIPNVFQQSQPIGNIQEHSRRMDWKSNYGGMPPPPPPPPNVQSSSRPNLPNTSQIGSGNHQQYHSTISHSNYSNQASSSFNQQRPINPQLQSNLMSINRNVLQPTNNNLTDQMNYINKSIGLSSSNAIQNSNHSMSSTSSYNRSHIENLRLNQTYEPSKSNSQFLKRYVSIFPPNSVEATQPDYSKKRKYRTKDIKVFNPVSVTMALKSGLVTEINWALNSLNIWSRDDAFFEKLNLKNLMPMFQALIDVWRNSLGTIFGRTLFIKELELPVILDENVHNKMDIKIILKKIGTVLKNRQFKQEKEVCTKFSINKSEDDYKFAQDKVIDLLHGTKYSVDRNGLAVKLDLNAKLEYALDGDSNLKDFIIKMCSNSVSENENDSNNNLNYFDCKIQSQSKICCLSDLWTIGGSDSTYHILPPLLSQNKNTNNEWYLQLANCDIPKILETSENSYDPPEIKRSRCASPHSPLSSNPPRLEHENHMGNIKFSESVEDIECYRLQAKSEIVNDGETLFFNIEDSDEEKMLRCISVSNAIRNLSFLNGNDRLIGSNRATLVILGRLLLLGHEHSTDEWPTLNNEKERWWLKWIDDIREHVFVTLVNISSYLELSKHHEIIVRPIITGLLHWLTCSSAAAEDSLPSHRVLGCRRLALESLMRLCVHEKNIDYILSTNKGSDSVIRELFNYLTSSFCYPDVQIVKEMALAVMHYLSMGGENGIGCIYLANAQPNIISGLISFIEITESQIRHVVDNMGMEALQARPELMGTSLEFLRHSGALLNRIASFEVNRKHFSRDHEIRMLNLVISTVLDQTVAQSISGVLYLISNHDVNQSKPETCNKFKSFLTFNDLSFCEKDNSVSSIQETETTNVTNCAN